MAKETITVNNRSYRAKELDFNFLCNLSEAGIEIQDVDKKIIPTLRVYVAYCMGVNDDIAGDEINNHIINGGKFEDLADVFSEKAESSDFFRAINKTTEKKSTATSKKSSKSNEQTEA